MSLEQFNIIESTLREGEQFVNAFFTIEQKIEIARLLDAFGVEYLELTTPCASPQSEADCRAIASLGLRAKTLTHTRCAMEDVRRAVDTGVNGVDVVIGTSSYLREFSHGKSIERIVETALEVIGWLKTQAVEVRFSTEDSLRSEVDDLYRVYAAVDQMGVDRVGIADTVGIGNPRQIYDLVAGLHSRVRAGIEFHGHNDTGCAIANAFAALEAGASYIDTSVLGIGERNGITSLGGLVARLYAIDPALVSKYDLPLLLELDRLVAGLVGVDIPFNNYITGFSAFTHKAGIHAKAVLNNPSTYEVLRPEDFGLTRYIHIAHRLTGWNAVRYRAGQLGLELDDQQARDITDQIKRLSDERVLTLEDVDSLLLGTLHTVHAIEEA
jgi:homocitrate synthase